LQFNPYTVATGSSFSAKFFGVNLTDETFFDVLFTAPGSNDSDVALNWQKGLTANHSVTTDISPGTWTIIGARAHKIETDHSGSFVPLFTPIKVSP